MGSGPLSKSWRTKEDDMVDRPNEQGWIGVDPQDFVHVELKPCPFCGSANVHVMKTEEWEGSPLPAFYHFHPRPQAGMRYVYCASCKADGPTERAEGPSAVELWNRPRMSVAGLHWKGAPGTWDVVSIEDSAGSLIGTFRRAVGATSYSWEPAPEPAGGARPTR